MTTKGDQSMADETKSIEAEIPPREPNKKHLYGEMKMGGIGPQADVPEFDALAVNRADDYALIKALCYRGYDVTARQTPAGAAAKRIAKAAKRRLEVSEQVSVAGVKK